MYDRRSLVKQSFITEINIFLPIYCSFSYFTERKWCKAATISSTNQKSFTIEKTAERSELDLQITKVSGKKIEMTDQKAHNIQLTRLGKKRR